MMLQTCISANRVMVQAGIYDKFVAAVKAAMQQLQVGDGMADGTTVGPLINTPQMNKVRSSTDI